LIRFFQNSPLKRIIFFNNQKGQKWPNGLIISFEANSFKKAKFGLISFLKGKMATLIQYLSWTWTSLSSSRLNLNLVNGTIVYQAYFTIASATLKRTHASKMF